MIIIIIIIIINIIPVIIIIINVVLIIYVFSLLHKSQKSTPFSYNLTKKYTTNKVNDI